MPTLLPFDTILHSSSLFRIVFSTHILFLPPYAVNITHLPAFALQSTQKQLPENIARALYDKQARFHYARQLFCGDYNNDNLDT